MYISIFGWEFYHQQLQRYEAEDYRTVSFSTFLKFIAIAGLEVQVSAKIKKSNPGTLATA